MTNFSKIVGWGISIQVYVWEALYLMLSLFGQDSTGLLLKISQILTFILRLPYLNFRPGTIVEEFLGNLRRLRYSSEPNSTISDANWISREKFSGIISHYDLDPSKDYYFLGKSGALYIFTFLLIVISMLQSRDRRKNTAEAGRLRSLYLFRRMNFALTCLILLDTIFYAASSVVQMEFSSPKAYDVLIITHLCIVMWSFSNIIQQANSSHLNAQTNWVLRYYNEFMAFEKGTLVPSAKTLKLNKVMPEKSQDKTIDQDTLDLSVLDGLRNLSLVLSPHKNFSAEGETKMSKHEISMAEIFKEEPAQTKIEDEWELEKKGFTKVINIQASLRHAESN